MTLTVDPPGSPPPPPVGFEEPPQRPHPRRRRRWWWVVPVLLVALLIASGFVRVPYYTIAPGNARSADVLVEVPQERRNEPAGDIMFTTVSLRPASLLGALSGWLDPDIEVVTEETVLGNRSAEENREYNLALMDSSKEVALYVALARLGEPVELSGGGAVVLDVDPAAPAAAQLGPGDVIVEAGGAPVVLSEQLRAATAGRSAGDELALRVERDGEVRDETVRLTTTAEGRPIIGIRTATRDSVEFGFPFDVAIDSGSVGGPSAGLAFTLATMDVLTAGELTGGHKVAATGTIEPDGRVGPVGGVAQKTAAARAAGAELFLVPRDEEAAARERAGDMRVEAVDTLDDALAVLASMGGNVDQLPAPVSPATPR